MIGKQILARFMLLGLFVVVSVSCSTSPPSAADNGPRPSATPTPAHEGNAVAVAQAVIRDNFERSDCPSVTTAQRVGVDGSIKAACSNGETFRVFRLNGKAVAMKCSAAARLGVAGC